MQGKFQRPCDVGRTSQDVFSGREAEIGAVVPEYHEWPATWDKISGAEMTGIQDATHMQPSIIPERGVQQIVLSSLQGVVTKARLTKNGYFLVYHNCSASTRAEDVAPLSLVVLMVQIDSTAFRKISDYPASSGLALDSAEWY